MRTSTHEEWHVRAPVGLEPQSPGGPVHPAFACEGGLREWVAEIARLT